MTPVISWHDLPWAVALLLGTILLIFGLLGLIEAAHANPVHHRALRDASIVSAVGAVLLVISIGKLVT